MDAPDKEGGGAVRSRPKTVREAIARINSLPRGRRITGLVGAIGWVVLFVAIIIAYQKNADFIALLVLAFLFFLFLNHGKYALDVDLTQRKTRKIDYWYLGATTIGLFVAAASYSTQRETTIVRISQRLYEAGEARSIAEVNDEISLISKLLCTDAARAKEVCAGLKKIAAEIKPGRSKAQIASILQELEQKVTVPYGQLFTREQLDKDPNLFLPVVSVQIMIEDW